MRKKQDKVEQETQFNKIVYARIFAKSAFPLLFSNLLAFFLPHIVQIPMLLFRCSSPFIYLLSLLHNHFSTPSFINFCNISNLHKFPAVIIFSTFLAKFLVFFLLNCHKFFSNCNLLIFLFSTFIAFVFLSYLCMFPVPISVSVCTALV